MGRGMPTPEAAGADSGAVVWRASGETMSFGSWMAAGRSAGGLGLGRWPVSICFAIVVVGLVAYMALTNRQTRQRDPSSGGLEP